MVLRRTAGAGCRISQGPNIPKVLILIPMNDTTVHPFMYVQVTEVSNFCHYLLYRSLHRKLMAFHEATGLLAQGDLNGRWLTVSNLLLSRLSSSEFHNSEKDSNP